MKIALIGSGWRAETWLNVILSLKNEDFELYGMLVRNQEKQSYFKSKYNVNIIESYEILDFTKFDLALISVKSQDNYQCSKYFLDRNVAVLCETPAGVGIAQRELFKTLINSKNKIQIAEQYHLQPRFQALKTLIESGILGKVNSVILSCCHDYHFASLSRFLLGVDGLPTKSQNISLNDSYCETDGRNGYNYKGILQHQRKMSVDEYGEKYAIYDFSSGQYFSNIRANRIIIQGEMGEIINDSGYYIKDNLEMPIKIESVYQGLKGNLHNHNLLTINANGMLLYQNKYVERCFTEEQIAMAECLDKMKKYMKNGEEFYSLKRAIEDSEIAKYDKN